MGVNGSWTAAALEADAGAAISSGGAGKGDARSITLYVTSSHSA